MKIKQLIKSQSFKKYVILFLNGLVSSLAFAPFYLFPILFLSFFVLLRSLEKAKTKKEGFLIGWWFGFGHFISGTYWMCISLLVDPVKFAWLIPFAISLIPSALAVYIGLTTLCTYILKTHKKITNRFLLVTIFASFWILFEYLRTILFSGFPWNLVGNVWCFSDIMIQIVSLIGIYGFGFLTVVFFSFIYLIFEKKNILKYLIVYFSVFLAVFLFGFFRLKNAKNELIPNIKMRIIQPSIKQNLKWDSTEVQNNILKHISLSKSKGFDEITHIVWSESAIPYIVKSESLFLKELNSLLPNKILITGGIRAKSDGNKIEKLYNSIFVIKDSKVLDYYDKVHLVPFGEYIPFRKFIPFVSKVTHGSIDFSSGLKARTIKLSDEISFSPLICYEVIFPEKVVDYNNIPDIIVNLTNDGWFGNSTGPQQHFDNAKLRAVENGISVVRVANNGISAVIDGYGRVQNKLKTNEIGFLDIDVSKKIEIILYKKNKIILEILSLYIVLICLFKFNFKEIIFY